MSDPNRVQIEFLTLIKEITHDAFTHPNPNYMDLIETACKESEVGTSKYIATFKYLHKNLSSIK